MFGAILGVLVWILFFLTVGIGFFALFDPGLVGVLELLFTWAQVPVVAVALLTVYESGVPGGVGELKSALHWIRSQNPDEPIDYQQLPANTLVVGLELAAVTLGGVGFLLSTFFSLMLSMGVVGAFGRALFEPSKLAFAGITASEAFSLFLAGAILWQVAMFLEASSLV